MRKKRSAILLGILSLLMVFGSCHWFRRSVPVAVEPAPSPAGPAPPPASPKSAVPVVPEEGGYLTFAMEDAFTGLEAEQLATFTDRMIRRLVFRGLTRETPQGELEPELASGWEELRRGQEWILHLRPQTPFGNGRYLEARHVVASWEALIADQTSPHAWLLEPVKGFEDLRSGRTPHAAGLFLEDGLTLRVELGRPLPGFLWRLAHPALGVSAFGADQEGIGPFSLWSARGEEEEPGEEEVVLRSNPNYFRDPPYLDELVFVSGDPTPDRFAEANELDGGIVLPGEDVPSESGVRFFHHSVPRTYILGLNRRVAPFSSLKRARNLMARVAGLTWSQLGTGGKVDFPPTLVQVLASERKVALAPQTPPRLSGLGRLDVVVARGDRVADELLKEIQPLFAGAGARVVVHRARPSDLAGILRRREFHLFLLPYVPSSLNSLLSYEELIRWNPTTPESLLAKLRLLEQEEDAKALLRGLRKLDAALQAGGHLMPLVTVDRRFLVRNEICHLRPDPLGNLEWTVVWRNLRPSEGCGESQEE